MMRLTFILFLLLLSYRGHSQSIGISNSNTNINLEVADTLSYKVITNDNNIEITSEIRKKISKNRKEVDYLWEPEIGLKILIYKKDE